MFMKLSKIALAGALALGTIASTSLPVNSMPVTAGQSAQRNDIVSVQYDQDQGMQRNRQWSRMRDGDRCKAAYGKCQHFYRGYYYETPWWTLPLIIGGAVAANHDHRWSRAEWCRSRYRYNPRNNTFLARDGHRHVCRR